MPENKVVYGLKNCHYSVITEDAVTGAPTYSTPIALKGAVEISLDPRGETSDFYADNILYHTTVSNAGYEASLTIANISREFRVDVLGEELDADNILTESTEQRAKRIAFMFEFDGDIKAVRHCLYNCTVTRPSLTSATKTETAEPQPQELTMVAAPRSTDGIVKRSTTGDTPDAIYAAWYDSVYEPVVTP
jgi:phi13 family phage major tail protein